MALALTLGHASYRMVQFLSSPNWILDHENLHAALGCGGAQGGWGREPFRRRVRCLGVSPSTSPSVVEGVGGVQSGFLCSRVLHLSRAPLVRISPEHGLDLPRTSRQARAAADEGAGDACTGRLNAPYRIAPAPRPPSHPTAPPDRLSVCGPGSRSISGRARSRDAF